MTNIPEKLTLQINNKEVKKACLVFLLYISSSAAVLTIRVDSKQADVTVMGGLCRTTPPFIQTYRLKRVTSSSRSSLLPLGQSETHSAGGLRKHEDGGRLHSKARASGLRLPRKSDRVQSVRHAGAAGVKKSEEETEMKGEEEEGGCKGKGRERMMEDDVNFPLACSNKGEKRRKHSRKKSVNHFSIYSEAFFQRKVKLCHKEQK